MTTFFLVSVFVLNLTGQDPAMPEKPIPLSDGTVLRTDVGPVSFGLVMSGDLVSWSRPHARDLLIVRLWDGLYLYPTRKLGNSELKKDPIRIKENFGPMDVRVVPVDWNRDGRDELIVTSRRGDLKIARRTGNYPNLSFEIVAPIADKATGYPFNITWENPNHPVLDNAGGYFDPLNFNYLYPLVYPWGVPGTINLVIGDWAGNLWWLADGGDGRSEPVYRGAPYSKSGKNYTKPSEKICDETGRPFLLGKAIDRGVRFQGGDARPFLYFNETTRSPDLLVVTGMDAGLEIFYLRRVSIPGAGKPAFRNLGPVVLEGIEPLLKIMYFMHLRIVVVGPDLLMTLGNRLARFRRIDAGKTVPRFRFNGWVEAKDGVTDNYNFTEMLTDRKTEKRYLIDCGTPFVFREVILRNRRIRLRSIETPVRDQHGLFSVDGGTDPNLGEKWGYHRITRWNFDGTDLNHLLVGTDKGLLFLLIEKNSGGKNQPFSYHSAGPLRDGSGRVIRIHNRTMAGAADLDRDGREDLLLGGISYQLGISSDPNPGGGLYYLLNGGVGRDGLPVFKRVEPLQLDGQIYSPRPNQHIFLQAIDLDRDGEKEVTIGFPENGYRGRIYRVMKDRIALAYSGYTFDRSLFDCFICDLDADGKLDLIQSGGETGIGSYYRLLLPF